MSFPEYFPKYFVTYCVMDTEAGANPFGHACLLFSEQNSEVEPVRVIDSIGYYSQPSTTTNPIIKFIKTLLSLPVDLQDTHGVLKREKMRELNGAGLKGMSFELTLDQYNLFSTRYKTIMNTEQEAIDAYNTDYEALSTGPYRLVQENTRNPENPRLKPFHISGVLNSEGSYTCKQRALDLLFEQGIINQKIRNEVTGGKSEYAFPRFSKGVRPIYIISSGRVTHTERNGRHFYNHQWPSNADNEDNADNADNVLHFATPVKLNHDLETEEEHEYYFLIKNIMARIYKVESLLRAAIRASATEPSNNEDCVPLETLLKQVTELRKTFRYTSTSSHTQLKKNIKEADSILNKATMATYSEDYINSFMLRAYASMSAKNALFGLLAVMICASVLVAPPIGIAVTVAAAACVSLATLYTAKNAHRFFNEEQAFKRCKATQDTIGNSEHLPTLIPAL